MRIILISAAIGALVVSSPLGARERILAPTDDWRLEPTGESCVLTRNYQDSRNSGVRFQIQNFQRRAALKITMIGKALPLRKGPRGIAVGKYRFMPDSSWREGIGATGSIGGINSMTFYADLVSSEQSKQWAQRESLSTEEVDRYFDTRVAEIDRIAIAFPSRDEFVLPLGPMAKPYDDLQACTRELARGWGYDPTVLNNLRNGPRLQNSEEISTFVIDALRKAGLRYADAIHYRLAIDERGAIAGCVVQYPKRTDATETTVCALLKDKARFEPAMDGDGNPVRAPSVSRIVFGL